MVSVTVALGCSLVKPGIQSLFRKSIVVCSFDHISSMGPAMGLLGLGGALPGGVAPQAASATAPRPATPLIIAVRRAIVFMSVLLDLQDVRSHSRERPASPTWVASPPPFTPSLQAPAQGQPLCPGCRATLVRTGLSSAQVEPGDASASTGRGADGGKRSPTRQEKPGSSGDASVSWAPSCAAG